MTQCVFALPALIDVSAELIEHASEFPAELADFVVSLRGYVDREIVRTSDDSELSGQNAERGDHRRCAAGPSPESRAPLPGRETTEGSGD